MTGISALHREKRKNLKLLSDNPTPLHVEHTEHPAGRRRGIQAVFADIFRRRVERGASYMSRDGRHECSFPGHGAARAAAHRASQRELGGGRISGRKSRICGADKLGRRIQAHIQIVRDEFEERNAIGEVKLKQRGNLTGCRAVVFRLLFAARCFGSEMSLRSQR